MIKPRIRAVEKRLAQHRQPAPKALRVVEWWPDKGEPKPIAAPGEDLLIIEIVDPRARDAAKNENPRQ